MFFHFPMQVFTEHLTYVLRWVSCCEHLYDSLESLPQNSILDNCDVFWPDLTNMREKHMFLHFPMWVFTKHLTFVFRCVYFCEHIWDSLELLPPELHIWPIWMFSGRI